VDVKRVWAKRKVMLILGRKYKFTKFEKYRLKKAKFKTTTVRYRKRPPEEVLEELKALEDKHSIIVINTKDKVDDRIVKYLTQLQLKKDVAIISIEKFVEKYLYKCYIPEDDADLNYLSDIRPYSAFEYVQKRIVDYLAVFVIFFLSWPVLLYARYRIKKESPGTSMFKQYRVGLNNQEFKCVKFRSMRLDAEKDGAKFASQNDPRVFPWGEFMRKTRIDELPQMINILRGEMHFVGPRPERKIWTDKFEEVIPYYSERHLVRPGITGWAQVMYPYGSNAWDAKQKLMYDLYYIKHWSIWLEIKIIFKTIGVVLGRKGV
jgi:lipopolysaccharide/colanic/teichoic acid biosynthesis glycosyltransferase